MKKTKIIIPALGILLLSTAASVTGTVAWFSMNEKVSATGMQIKAKGEAGIAIGAYTANNATAPVASAFSDTASGCNSSKADMIPTWTNDASNWYHAKSVNTNSAAASAADGYEKITTNAESVYLYNKFQLKATGQDTDVFVKNIVVEGGNSASSSFDNCIRVLVKAGDAVKVFAPVSHATNEEVLAADLKADDAVETDLKFTLVGTGTDDAKIFTALSTTPQDVSLYFFYDGEDADCISDNIPATWQPSNITVSFSNTK